MTLVNIATGEIAESITAADVDASIERVRLHAESIWDEWAWQVENKVWLIESRWDSWNEMRAEAYSSLDRISTPRADTPELVARFRAAGLTQKETAATLGIGQATVSRHDEPVYAPKSNIQMDIDPEEVIEAEIVHDGQAPMPAPAARERDGATTWSHQVQTISASIPMEDLTYDELVELLGAVEYLHNYIKGERITRQGRNQR